MCLSLYMDCTNVMESNCVCCASFISFYSFFLCDSRLCCVVPLENDLNEIVLLACVVYGDMSMRVSAYTNINKTLSQRVYRRACVLVVVTVSVEFLYYICMVRGLAFRNIAESWLTVQ